VDHGARLLHLHLSHCLNLLCLVIIYACFLSPGVIEPFPEKLMRLLNECEAAGRTDVVAWIANGRAFAIHKPDKFFKEIVPLYFRQSRLSSFKRQLNLYGYELINSGPARGGYFHDMFVRDRPELSRRMRRVAVKVGSCNKNVKQVDDFAVN
jgi:hypothetical protein